jgi:hypothetical protein
LEASNEDSFGLLKTRLSEANVKFSEERDVYPGVSKLIRFLLPSGHPMELYSSAGETNQSFYPTAGVRPRRLGHALLKVNDLPKVEDFLTEILSFRVSDRGVGGEIVWLRCSEIHHSINLLHGSPGLHHYAWEVDDWATCYEAIKVSSCGDQGATDQETTCSPIMRTRQAPSSNTLPISLGLRTKKTISGEIGLTSRSGITSGDRFPQRILENTEWGWSLSVTTSFDSSKAR